MSAPRTQRTRGFALPSAIIALVLLSTLVVGALFVATEELRAGRSDVAEQRALAVAELAIEQMIAGWSSARNTALGVGTTVTADAGATGDGERVDVTITRVQARSVWVVVHASARDGRAIPARRVIGASLRLMGPSFPLQAALTAAGAVTVRDGGVVDGQDERPSGTRARWCASDVPDSVAGVMVPDSTRVCGAECTGTAPPGVAGAPPVATASIGPSDASFSQFGDETRGSLAARATVVLGAGVIAARPVFTGAECDVTTPFNWGDPDGLTPCADHYPIVWVRGDAVLAAGSTGQGVLLVDGDLEVEPGARFAGVVVVADDITVRGPGAVLAGLAFAADADAADGTRVVDGGIIRVASCTARVAMLGAARLARTPVRWWAELR